MTNRPPPRNDTDSEVEDDVLHEGITVATGSDHLGRPTEHVTVDDWQTATHWDRRWWQQ